MPEVGGKEKRRERKFAALDLATLADRLARSRE
jgi:hypothetical protein